ncbi:hypothetical protein MHN00_20330 [Alteromonas sp. Cnat2-8]|nr:hypothetical protein [Alteromonas sp. Cnat2-8]MCG7655893.1 hypothetical protein [Alteromonas sp. Cnat2-8]
MDEAHDIIINILEPFPELDNGHSADWYPSEVIEFLEKVKAHTETTF